jgi:hypothetical protein
MTKFNIDLSKTSTTFTTRNEKIEGWKGTVIKQREPSKNNRNIISMDETILRSNKALAVNDIFEKTKMHNVDFQSDEVVWEKTQERLLTKEDLIDKIDQVN